MKKLLKITFTLLFITTILLGFAMPLNPVGNWYQQFMPNIGSRTIQDIFFVDSLTGWAVTNATNQGNDTLFVLKTTNSGNNWIILYRKTQTGGGFSGYFKIYFLDQNIGYTTDVRGIYRTSDGGSNWTSLNAPQTAYLDMSVKNTDTIWIVTPEIFAGGVFFTSTGGLSWHNQFSGGNQNPNKIYMYNARIGFISNSSAGSPNIYKTTNGGTNWSINLPGEYFFDMHFTDSLTGWKCMPGSIAGDSCVKKTTNGGTSWFKQQIPMGGMLLSSQIQKFSFVNKDTIWGAGGAINYGVQRGILYRTTNGGVNWGFLVPDTAYDIGAFGFVQFINKNTGWALGQLYNTQTYRTIHTTNGGDTTFYFTGVQQISNEIPNQFTLYQNYPNPFNPVTNIGFRISVFGLVTLKIFDITGREVSTLIKEELNAGEYKADWNAPGLASGVYFYRLTVASGKEVFTETKKMLMIK